MTEIDVSSWESFEKELKELREAEVPAKRTADFVFRGLSDSTLPLVTTLERGRLLDWTRSPYIAAYFAFRCPIRPAQGKVSICVFSEHPEFCKSSGG